ncbi:TetR/AcrR family transcriptional regulator [Cellulomonas composti]|uniref:TetR family transcriptional regulator n=1 Tax=Cellulomonas composti TaxID=266130 RepID=A0A511J974_9CELL|nr:TetR/AcrR family transcriptional regulator [Cellulomonas composti]GEL94542.1 TetR family transcriptional regulator [Cellulomonas composti]
MPATPPVSARERARASFTADLLAAARTRIAAEGAAELSLRAVARDLGVSSSAVYRYVDSRDALLTLLIIEAYDEVGTVVETAAASATAADPPADPGTTWLAVGRAFIGWAREHRHSFELVYGTPVPGYAAPPDTVVHATRVWAVLGATVAAAAQRGELGPAALDGVAHGLMSTEMIDAAVRLVGGPVAGPAVPRELVENLVVRTVPLFTTLLGATTAELFGHLHGMTDDHDALLDAVLAAAGASVGLRVPLGGG